MSLRLVNTFEGDTNGSGPFTVSGVNAGSLNGNGWDFVTGNSGTVLADNTNAKHGTKSVKVATDGASASYMVWSESSITVSPLTGYLRFYFKLNSLPGNNAQWIVFKDAGGASPLATIVLSTSGKIILLDGNGAVQATSTTTLGTGQWGRLEAKLFSNNTTGSLDVRLFLGANAEGSTPDETVSFANQYTLGNHIRWVQIGAANIVSGWTVWMDSIEYNDFNWAGPYSTPVPSAYETLMASNATYPYMLPLIMDNSDTTTYSMGMLFHATVAGKVYGAAWANGLPATSAENGLVPQIALYPSASGTPLASKTTTATERRGNWTYELFTTPIDIAANTDYVIVVFRKGYPHQSYFFDASNGGHGVWSNAHLVATDVTTSDNNFFDSSGSIVNPFGVASFHSTWYGIDVLFAPTTSSPVETWGIPIA